MKKNILTNLFFCIIFIYYSNLYSQKPKLIIGIVIDQMRWDYLYRYNNSYDENGGFKILLNNGTSCEQTYINYIPTYTACGHSSIYTSSIPSLHGIIGNEWYDRNLKKQITSVFDTTYNYSPRNMNATTIGDQLKLSTNFKSRSFSVSLKDRSSILPCGHSCNTAFWWNKKIGNWQTSKYYNKPNWFNQYNAKNLVDSFYKLNWKPLYNINYYVNSTNDNKVYENGFIDKNSTIFNYKLEEFINKDYDKIYSTPYGNSITLEFAKHIINSENLGQKDITDILSISLSSTDIIGHNYGPNSIEMEDTYLRLDRDLADFISFIDKNIGRKNYILFLTADHGVSHIPEYLNENNINLGGRFKENEELLKINKILNIEFKTDSLVLDFENFQFYLNKPLITNNNLDYNKIIEKIISYYEKQENTLYIFECSKLLTYSMPNEIKEVVLRGYNHKNSGEIQIILKPFNIQTWHEGKGTTHGSLNSYDSHIPLIWFGNKIPIGKKIYNKYFITDIASTLSSLLQIENPSSSIGNIIKEVIQ